MNRLILFLSSILLVPAAMVSAQAGESAQGSSLRAEDLRVAAVAYRLALGGAPDCPADFPLTGMLLHHLAEYAPDDQPRAIALYQVDRGPGVLAVVAGGPAARAGLMPGDVILAVNKVPFPAPVLIAAETKRKIWRKMVEASEAQLEDQLRLGPVRLDILRAGAESVVMLDSIPACPARVRLARSNQLNAFADGKYVTATTALLDFVRNDDELAIALAHEMAHNILAHPALLDEQGVPRRGMMRGFGGNAKRVWATEAEADRFSIALAWRAGFDVSAAIPFWRRLYASRNRLPQIFRTHPSLGAREKIVNEAIAALPSR
ncbi:M48 family metallopeptidase [Sphingosinicella rhizophila]|uniref:M48 family metallopeptidase n=1 Tax=Sphingosinicella rhizophila TaxID=3050082 RepID=A0ABU3Q9I3_9SPHN|nr:M48 family metallopeptidase [Sphingosinicella sp. GR2756]MDT9599653.1 M48 family metallopeptidase [Sphingosinicella sp. GR2756]